MTYVLHRLTAGNYDLLFDGQVVGSVLRSTDPDNRLRHWRAELLDDAADAWRPPPFKLPEHQFDTLMEVRDWLGTTTMFDFSPPRRS